MIKKNICVLLDELFPNNGWMHIPYEVECEAVLNWCTENNFILYERPKSDLFEWEAIELAELAGARGYVLSSLS